MLPLDNRHLTDVLGLVSPVLRSRSDSVFSAGTQCEALPAIAATIRLVVPLCCGARLQEIQTVTQL